MWRGFLGGLIASILVLVSAAVAGYATRDRWLPQGSSGADEAKFQDVRGLSTPLFIADIKRDEVRRSLNKLTLANLAVGDTARLAAYVSFCLSTERQIMIRSNTEIETSRSEASPSWLIKVMPGRQISLTFEDPLRAVVAGRSLRQPAELLSTDYVCRSKTGGAEDYLGVVSVNGKTKISELIADNAPQK